MEAIEAFKQEQWDSVEISLGQHTVLAYDIVTPVESVKCLVWSSDDGRLFQTSASNSYSAVVAERLLDSFKKIDLSKLIPGRVAVSDASFQPMNGFEVLAIAPPEIALFEHLSEGLRSRMHLVLPAYRSELRNGMSAKDFRHQLGRKDGWRVYVYRWNRSEKRAPSWE